MTFQSNLTVQNGYYSLLTDTPMIIEPLTSRPPISLTDPSNVFQLDNIVSDRLNQFQVKYSRYLQCQGPFQNTVSDPSCGKQDSLNNVEKAYYSLLTAIQDVSNSFATQYYTGKSNEQYDACFNEILTNYQDVVAFRKKLDEQLYELQLQKEGGPDSYIARFESTVYINTLWIILATILVYFIFIGF
jgi:hypothetical protein